MRGFGAVTHVDAFAFMREKGAVLAKAHFSGGNDEGGIDGITLLDANGVELPYEYSWDDSDEQDALARDADGIVTGEYGSFAGEFSVHGTVTYDLNAGTVKMSKEEQSGYDHSEYDL